MTRSALPVALLMVVAVLLIALGWVVMREPPGAPQPQPQDVPPAAAAQTSSAVELPPLPGSVEPGSSASPATVRAPLAVRTIRGQVRCEDEQAPLGAIHVALLEHPPHVRLVGQVPPALATASVSADGSFTIGPIPAAAFYLHAEGGEYLQVSHDAIDPSALVEPVILTIVPSQAIEGLVHSQGGEPIVAATVALGDDAALMNGLGFAEEDLVELIPAGETAARDAMHDALAKAADTVTTVTDARGRFRFERLAPDDGRLIEIAAPGYATYRQMCAMTHGTRTLFVDAELEPAGRIIGAVRDQGGQPLSGASVHALRSNDIVQSLLGGGMSYASVRTSDDGSYALDHLPAGSYRIEARRKGWPAQVKSDLDLAAGAELRGVDFTLDPGGTIQGIVLDPGGKPIAGAKVSAVEPPSLTDLISVMSAFRDGKPVETDAEGRFALDGLRSVKHTVSAKARDYVETSRSDVLPGSGPVTLQLLAPARVSGVVMSTTSGEPVRDYELDVTVTPSKTEHGSSLDVAFSVDTEAMGAHGTSSTTIRDPSGRFEIGGLAPGSARIAVDADGHAPAAVADVSLKGGETTKGVIIFLDAEGVVEGVVREAGTGKPLPAAKVHVALPSIDEKAPPGQAWRTVVPATEQNVDCDASGRFRAPKLTRGTAEVRATLEHYEQAEPLRVAIVPGKVAGDVVLEMRPRIEPLKGAVEGTVYTVAGKPHKGAMLFATQKLSFEDLGGDPAITDGRGHFQINDLPVGRTNLILLNGEGDLNLASLLSMFTRRQVVPVEIKAGETVSVTIREQGEIRRGCRVHGTVSSGGAPLPHAMLMAIPESGGGLKMATTDDQGRYELNELVAGRWRFAVTEGEGVQTGSGVPIDVPDAADAERDVRVPEGKIAGVVIDASTKQPIEGIAVFATPEDVAPASFLASVFGRSDSIITTDARGAFELPRLAPGSYTVHAGGAASRGSAREYTQASRTAVAIAGGASATVDFALQHGREVSGVVSDQSGRGIAGVMLTLHDPGGASIDGSEGVISDGEGRYRYAGLPAGRFYLVAAWKEQVVQASELFDVSGGSDAHVDLVLVKGIAVTVSLTNLPNQVDFGNLEVTATDAKGRVYRRMVSDELIEAYLLGGFTPGEYHLGPFPPGPYTLIVRRGEDVLLTRGITLKKPEGESIEIDGAAIR
ncbi:MAG: carboxypeptidase-like regulatory domain-containing protein [Planctomycetota bacterium]